MLLPAWKQSLGSPRVSSHVTLRRLSALALLLLLPACAAKKPQAKPQPPEAGYVTLQTQSVPLSTELSGRTSPYLVAEVRPQVGGIVKARAILGPGARDWIQSLDGYEAFAITPAGATWQTSGFGAYLD